MTNDPGVTMMINKIRLIAATLTCVATLLLTGCSKGVSYDDSPSSTPNSESAKVSPSPANSANPSAAPRTPGGAPIDTSQLDANIAEAESTLQQKPADDGARLNLAHAYLARADALTKSQQYGSALGDYRRTLKYEPQNKSALDMSTMIIDIFKSLGREAPAEGKEPSPKPFTGNVKEAEGSNQKSY